MSRTAQRLAIAALALVAVCSDADAKARAAKPAPAAPPIPGDAAAGFDIFKRQCAACHGKQSEGSALGPPLLGVVGAKAASSAFTGYTAALKASGVVWTPAKLEDFLSGPGKLVPGTAMMAVVPKTEDRQNLIAYLATLKK